MTDQAEQDTEAAGRLPRRPGDATVPADMCFRCHGENETAWSVCRACAIAEVRLAVSMAISDEMSVRTDRVESVLVALDSATERASAATGKQAFAQMEADEMRQRQRASNDLARQLADRTDEFATLRGQYEDLKDLCSEHSAELAATQVRLEDADAAVKRLGDELAWRVEVAKESRDEITELRERIAKFEAELAQLPTCGRQPSEFVAAIGFGAPCHLHLGHTGQCRYRRQDIERAERVRKVVEAAVPDCACGAPAAFGVGYHGEGAAVFQCMPCATADRRTPFFHRDVQSYVVHTCGPTPNALVCACGGPVNHEGSGRDAR